jgi:TATA-box binding protein (TBP) (component of TFIID and TFIIIB)
MNELSFSEFFLPVLVFVIGYMVITIGKRHTEYDEKFSDIDKKISK